jgi:hypothetical protein
LKVLRITNGQGRPNKINVAILGNKDEIPVQVEGEHMDKATDEDCMVVVLAMAE